MVALQYHVNFKNCLEIQLIFEVSITLFEIDGETVETVSDFILGGSKITADGDFSHEIKRNLLLRSKVMTNLDSIFKTKKLLCQQRLSAEELMLLNCGVGEDS